ncbi:hypothetical protein ASG43_12180 [Aureimonas sp. Leaf454]|nr:hypothetical protein ASG43_12180 [Aureimonas sp. Leaf454]
MEINNPDQGEAREELSAECEGPGAEDGIEIGFNAKYATDALATFAGETIIFSLADPGSPSLITDPSDATRQVVLMPMRV